MNNENILQLMTVIDAQGKQMKAMVLTLDKLSRIIGKMQGEIDTLILSKATQSSSGGEQE